ncbi:RtcB family protein [Parabacteroides sp. FAFU027]|uniref:RtcB family protein n=1 Tax=Parabacteroides sp. FAFU027 TaxID=2922715 RepID=UPI001FB040F8|nr:RtcB family protein [Parabacteroides sp. FAFU027]
MEKVINTGKLPIKLWLNDIEEEAMQQARNLANLPFAFRQICLMPDAHSGYGMPIGGVMATQNAIVPNAVGVDIGCGMGAIRTNLRTEEMTPEILKNIMTDIRGVIPFGFNHHKQAQDESLMPPGFKLHEIPVVKREYEAALKQIGTLGGGNHFLEIQQDNDDFVWIMVHSGSRNIGKQVADFYNKKAKKLNAMFHSTVDPKADLAFLPFDSEEAHHYYKEMRYCVAFAYANRHLMLDRIKEIFESQFSGIIFDPIINIAHNYAAWETHFGEKVLVHRKGATSARAGETGIIPGSQGTKSYIVEGLGNEESFQSCSHGAGRTMSRSKAIKTLDLQEEIRKLDEQGIIHAIRHKNDLEEAASAYKDISTVMNNQRDLVRIKVELSPMAVLKG